MPLNAEQLKLIRDFEPVLYHHRWDFVPSDAKRYVEHCALWKASDPFGVRPSWGTEPAIRYGDISADASESGTFLGRVNATGVLDFLETPPDKECFLELGGWLPPDLRYANIGRVFDLYESDESLKNSRYWYHAEFFDHVRLRGLFEAHLQNGGQEFAQLFSASAGNPAILKNPALVCYYLFYPIHDEGLEGCEPAEGRIAAYFASFAGDWTCIAVLFDRPTSADRYAPVSVGLSNRNTGIINLVGKEVRTGMRVLPWKDMPVLGDTHLQIAVAVGSHAYYPLGEVPEIVAPLTKDDPTRSYCGHASADDVIPDWHPPFHEGGFAVTFAKVAAGALIGAETGLLGGAIIGMVAGLIWGIAEWVDNVEEGEQREKEESRFPRGSAIDFVPDAAKRWVIHPVGMTVPDVPAERTVAWASAYNLEIDGRKYTSIVDRESQLFWTGDAAFKGYTGRWGQRVEVDEQTRRTGMRFPNFWLLFLEAMVRTDDPTPVRPQVMIDAAQHIPIGNATQGAPLKNAYDGNKSQDYVDCPRGEITSDTYIGLRFSAPLKVSGLKIWLARDRGLFNNTGEFAICIVYGKNSADPVSPTDGKPVRTFALIDKKLDGNNPSVEVLTRFNASVAYDRIWVTVSNPKARNLAVFAEIQWFQDT